MAGETIGEALVKIRADTKGFEEETKGKLGGVLGGAAKVGAAALAGVGLAAVAFGKESVQAFSEAEQAQVRLTDAYGKFPSLAGANIESFNKLAGALQLKTKFDDESIKSGAAVLAQFGLNEKQLADLTPLVADFAAKTGTDFPTAAEQVGKAILGQGRALKNVGIDFKDTGSAAGNLEQIMGGLRNQVGGFAEKEGKTAAGSLAIMKNSFNEIQETVGAALVPVLRAVLPAIQPLLVILGKVLGDVAIALAPVLVEIGTAFSQILTALSPLIPPLGQLLVALAPLIPPLAQIITLLVDLLVPILVPLIELIAKVANVLATVLAAGLGWVIEKLGPFIAFWKQVATVLLGPVIQAFQWVWEKLGPVNEAIKLMAQLALPLLKKAWENWGEAMEPIINVFQRVWGWIKKVVDFIGDLARAFNQIKLPAWLVPGSPSPLENTLAGIVGSMKQLRSIGGVNLSGGLSPVGAGAGGGTIVVPLYIDGREVARATASPMRDELNRIGRHTSLFGERA